MVNERPLSPIGKAIGEAIEKSTGSEPKVTSYRYSPEEIIALGDGNYDVGARRVFRAAIRSIGASGSLVRPLQEELPTAEPTAFGTPTIPDKLS